MKNVCLLGYGHGGRVFHAPLISQCEGLRLYSVVSSRRKEILKRYPNAKILNNIDSAISDDRVDIVVSALPNEFHFDVTESAILKGKDVVVEKPFVVRSEDGLKLVHLAKEKSVMLTVFHNRRWDGDYLAVKELVRSKRLGRLKSFYSHFDRWRPEVDSSQWRQKDVPGSGVLFDLGSHLIDQCLDLFGEPNEILSKVETQRKGTKADDFFELKFQYADGFEAVLTAGCLVQPPHIRFKLIGDKGEYVKFGLDLQEGLLAGDEINDPPGQLKIGTHIEPLERVGNYLDFYSKVAKGECPIDPNEAIRVIQLVERSHKGH